MSWLSRLGRLFRRAAVKAPPEAPPTPIRWAIVGLGNPGAKFVRSRHNSGYMVVDRIAASQHLTLQKSRFNGLTAETGLGGATAVMVKPETYYNRSGDCVAAVLEHCEIPVERLIVVHDELDLAPGRLRIKRGGGDAGNRGVRSVTEALGTPEFIRVRIGVGPAPAGADAPEYLLRPMSADEQQSLALDSAAAALPVIIAEGLERAKGRFNRRE